ncbi:O-FucT domain protein [Ceratobasidium sp. AG-Ba]|nr:O-FucT domain protein [Ceratobasidium sp. AG-Ba]QRW08481.1 O-FucT domain protein [Ceratobasidium sp. AG-Ba]
MPTGYSLLPQTQGQPRSHKRPRSRLFLPVISAFGFFVAASLFFHSTNPTPFSQKIPVWTSNTTNFDDLFVKEAQLPQHNLSAPYPEGQTGRYVRFSNQLTHLGWNNVLQERLLNTILAYESNRSPVFSPFEAWAHPPRDDHTKTGDREVLVIPYSALLAGPTVGAPWGAGDQHPRAISEKWWNTVCPKGQRTILDVNKIMQEIGKPEGTEVMKRWTDILNAIPESCVEVEGGVQIFDYLLIGSTRLLSLWDMFINHPTIKGLKDSDLVTTALSRNMHKLQAQTSFSWAASLFSRSNTITGLVAIHIRRGDYLRDAGKNDGHCVFFSKWDSTFAGWSQLPQLLDKFAPPTRGDTKLGQTNAELSNYYVQRCLPTPPQVATRLHKIRESKRLTHVFIATNAEPEYLAELKRLLVSDGWASDAIVTSNDLELNWQAASVGVAVDMAITSRAEVFVGNGFSSLSSNVIMKRMSAGMPLDTTRLW